MMRVNKLVLIVVFSVLSFGCTKKTQPEVSHQFPGLWSLYITEQLDPETGQWSEWKNGMQGYILYDDKNNMSVHLTTTGYQNTDLRFPNFTDTIPLDALKHLANSYVYFAKYHIDKDQQVVEHARISHSNPAMWNEVVKRRFTFSGDTLILQPLEQENSNLRLKWIKESEADQ